MIKLDRRGVLPPAGWEAATSRAFPNLAAFKRKATAFEALDIDDPVRRAGFKGFAPAVLPKTAKGDHDFKAIWGQWKQVLAEMSNYKCAYCECTVDSPRSGAVEHFRPKALFPLLVYDGRNYFLGCFGCNGAKWNKWPHGGTCYVRPDEDDLEGLFVFTAAGTMEAAVPGSPADATVQDFDLSRHWLSRHRAIAIAPMLDELSSILARKDSTDKDKHDQASRHLSRVSPQFAYSAAVRQCFRRAWAARFPLTPL